MHEIGLQRPGCLILVAFRSTELLTDALVNVCR